MVSQQEPGSTARVLRIATAAEVVFLIVSAFFLFTEHRAHYLGALPYALLLIAITAFLWLLAERGKHQTKPGSGADHVGGRKGTGHA
ncbi:MAG: DUF2933 domain-containing protein [Candidatus Acidiferrales bacterium]